QIQTTSIIGAVCGVVVGVLGAVWHGTLSFGLVVAVSMFISVNLSGAAGTAIPMVSKSLGFDPALTAGPFETALQDVLGVTIFLGLARRCFAFSRERVSSLVSVAQVVRVFALTGILSIGGGRAAFFYEALVARRRWMRVDEFLQDFTLAQLLPGATFSNLSITLGHRLAGVAGALGGLAAVVVPGGVVLVVLAALYGTRGLTPEVATLM